MNFREIVSTRVWQDLIQRSQRRIYRSSSILIRQGESASSVIALNEGIVKVVQYAENGNALTLTLRGPGQVLGEMGAILDQPRSATVSSVTACVGYVMSAHAFRGFLDRYELGTAVYKLAVDRMQEVERLHADLVSLTPAARVARVVAHLAAEVGRLNSGGILVELGMPRDELAAMAAMSRSAVVPLLGQLQTAGILALGRGRITIKDLDRLRVAAGQGGKSEPPHL